MNAFVMKSHIPRMTFSTNVETPQPVVQEQKSEEPKKDEKKEEKKKHPREELDPQSANHIIRPIGDALAAAVAGYLLVSAIIYLTDFPPICQIILSMAEQSPFLQEHIGTPMTRSLLWWGTATDDYAKVSIDITGPKGCARVDAKAVRGYNGEWEVVYLHGALPQFDMRLTDLLPPSELDNIMPYVPQADDPTAAHALRGAPALLPVANLPVANLPTQK